MREAAELAILAAALAIAGGFFSVPVWLLAGLPLVKVLASAAFYTLFLRRALRRPARAGAADLVGRAAVAATPLRPIGRIRIDGETWSARSADGRAIARCEAVDIVAVREKVLLVARPSSCDRATSPPHEYWNSREAS